MLFDRAIGSCSLNGASHRQTGYRYPLTSALPPSSPHTLFSSPFLFLFCLLATVLLLLMAYGGSLLGDGAGSVASDADVDDGEPR